MSKVKFMIGDLTDLNELQNVDGQFIIAVDDAQLNAYVDYDDDGTVTRKQIGGKVTGVKGDSEASYRTGNVNITPANIGLGNVGNFKAVSTAANQGLTATEKQNARDNIGVGSSDGTKVTGTVSYFQVAFTDSSISANAEIDGPYINYGNPVAITSVSISGTTITYQLRSSDAHGQSAYIWVR